MKRVLSAILVLALALSCMAVSVNAAELENLAKKADWSASSGDAAKAGDQDKATAWVADGADADITMALSVPLPMGYLEIAFGDVVATDFVVTASSDASSWTEIVNVTGNGKDNYVYEWTASTQRYLKVDINATEDNKPASIAEIVVRENKTKEDTSANSAYPSSGVEIPKGSYLIHGDIIGLEAGWGGNPATGAAAAFDGDVNTFFDPLGQGNGWAGIDAGEEMTLTKIVIHPRSANLARYYGAEIDGSNDPDFAEYTPIFISVEEAAEFDYIEIDAADFDDIGSFRYYRYFNTMSHGDVAEVELYGEPKDGTYAELSAYPSSGVKAPEGSTIIKGDIIGLEAGWGGNPATGAAAAFDGDVNTFFDPLGQGNGYAGIDAGQEYTLTKIVIHPRSANLARYYGAEIDGSNDPDFAEYTPIFISVEEAAEFDYIEIDAADFDEIGSFRYYRYFNTMSHGDVAEVELYGVPTAGTAAHETEAPVVETEPETEAPAPETEPETEAPVVETEPETEAPETEAEVVEEVDAPQTFDFGVVAAIAAVVSLAGYAVSKKH